MKSMVDKLRAYARALASRRDVVVVDMAFGEGVESRDPRLRTLPRDAALLYRDANGVELTWVFAEASDGRESFSKGFNGGRLNIVPLAEPLWWPRSGWEWVDFERYAMLDNVVEEGNTWLIHQKGETGRSARLLFHPASGPEGVAQFADIEAYLTAGARRGFVWYWQTPGYWEAEAFLTKLRERSLPATTPGDAVASALAARGLGAAEAAGLVAWLGPDASLLVPRA